MGAARMPPVKPWRWTRARYDEAVRTGVIDEDDRVELLDGLLVVREPQSSRHAATSLLVREALQRAPSSAVITSATTRRWLSTRCPSLSPISPWWPAGHGTICATIPPGRCSSWRSRARRSRKTASARVRSTPGPGSASTIVNLRDEVLEVYRDPVHDARGRYRYRTVRILRRGASVTPLAAPSARIRVAALL